MIKLRVPKWEKYNGRKDVDKTTWLRIENTTFHDCEFYELDNQNKLLWFYVLLECSRSNSKDGFFKFSERAAVSEMNLSDENELLSRLEILQESGFIKDLQSTSRRRTPTYADVTSTNADVSLRDVTRHNKTRHNARRSGVVTPPCETGKKAANTEEENNAYVRVDRSPQKDQINEHQKPKPKARKLKWEPEDMELAKDWIELARKQSPGNYDLEKFANAIRLARNNCQGTHDGMRKVFEFVKTHDFWRKCAYSPCGLLKKSEKDGPTKIQNIVAQLKDDSNEFRYSDLFQEMRRRDQMDPAQLDNFSPFD